jgi:hypothetical protein
MKRFIVAIPTPEGGVELNPMKEWLRQHPHELPEGFEPAGSTSHQFRGALKRAGWTVQETDSEVRMIRPNDLAKVQSISGPLGPGDGEAEEGDGSDGEQAFALEYQLRDFLAENLDKLRIGGRTMRVYVDPTGRDGIEYPTAVGPIDLLAVDETGAFVVFELKRARIADRAVGQLARYMGWVKHTIGRDRSVRGIIVAKSIDTRLRYAAMILPAVTLLEYQVKFELHDASSLADIPR